MGAPITGAYQQSTTVEIRPLIQYASRVYNVSSFWGGSSDWSPLQALGPQDCPNVAADCTKAWCTLTMNGDGGFKSGSGQGLTFAFNPSGLYKDHGCIEFIELMYDHPVYPSALVSLVAWER